MDTESNVCIKLPMLSYVPIKLFLEASVCVINRSNDNNIIMLGEH